MSPFIEAFREVVAREPEAIALTSVDDDGVEQHLTYEALLHRASLLAETLYNAGVRPGETLAIACGRTQEHIIAMLGAWMAGAAWMTLDTALPPRRSESMLRKASVRRRIERGLRVVSTGHLPSPRPTDACAYVCFSSGSSGEPKGIAVGHEGIVPMLRAQREAFALHRAARVLWLYSPSFDAAISDIGVALLSGATLVIPTSDLMRDVAALARTLASQAITHVDLPPSLLPHLDLASLRSLECVVLGGECAEVRCVQQLAARVRVVNVYGPTEATVCSSLVVCDATWARPTVGFPLAHVVYRVVKPEAPHEEADEGELWIAGSGVALGYVSDEALTRARFVEVDGVRFFRTGDRVRRDEGVHGFAFLGRIDRQRKIDGKIVSPEEVEAVLVRMLGAEACVVATRTEPHRLVAFVAPHAVRLEEGSLRVQLAASLPKHMIPWRFVQHALPRNAHGKLDLLALTELADALVGHADVDAEETLLARLERLAAGPVRADMTLDALGLSSLDRVELLAWLRRQGRSVSTAMLEALTVAELCDAPRATDVATVHELEHALDGVPAAMRLDMRDRANAQVHGALSVSCTLVTGGTGFLGRRWVRALLSAPHGEVVCLVRGADARAARARLLACLGPLSRDQERRVEVVCGDVALDAFGLDAVSYARLTERVDGVVHCAASMSVVASREGLWNANVGGTARILRFVQEGMPKALDYVSTLAVLAATDRTETVFEEGDDARTPCRIFGGYAQTKWCAEQCVRRAAPLSAAPTRIHRLGLLVGNHSAADWLTSALHGLLEVGAYPDDLDPDLACDITPVEDAVRTCVALQRAPSGTFHVCGRTLRLEELLRHLAQLGARPSRVSRAAFRRLLVGQPGVATSTLQLAFERGPVDASGFDLFLATRRAFSASSASAELARQGLPPIDVSDARIIALLRDILDARAKEPRP